MTGAILRRDRKHKEKFEWCNKVVKQFEGVVEQKKKTKKNPLSITSLPSPLHSRLTPQAVLAEGLEKLWDSCWSDNKITE